MRSGFHVHGHMLASLLGVVVEDEAGELHWLSIGGCAGVFGEETTVLRLCERGTEREWTAEVRAGEDLCRELHFDGQTWAVLRAVHGHRQGEELLAAQAMEEVAEQLRGIEREALMTRRLVDAEREYEELERRCYDALAERLGHAAAECWRAELAVDASTADDVEAFFEKAELAEGRATAAEHDASPSGVWETYPADDENGWSRLQTALIDAINSISCVTDGPPDASTTRDLAVIVGCDVHMAYEALLKSDYASPHWPDGVTGKFLEPDEELEDEQERAAVLWTIPDCWDADDDPLDWFTALLEMAERLGHAAAAEHWRTELAAERAEQDGGS